MVMGSPHHRFSLGPNNKGAMTMSQQNFMALAFQDNLKRNPDLFTIDIEQHEKNVREHSEEMAKANPPKPQSEYEEYRQLRGRLHELEQRAQHTTVYFNNISGTVDALENRLDDAEKNVKDTLKAGNELAERHAKYVVERLQGELADAKKELRRARTQREYGAKNLEAFNQ